MRARLAQSTINVGEFEPKNFRDKVGRNCVHLLNGDYLTIKYKEEEGRNSNFREFFLERVEILANDGYFVIFKYL